MKEKKMINDLLKCDSKDFENIKVRFCAKNYEPKYAIDDYKNNPEKVNGDWFLWKRERRLFKVGEVAICLVRIYDSDEWLLTSIKRITKVLDVYDKKGFEAEELEEYKKYFGKILIKFHKDIRSVCVRYNKICSKLEIVDEDYTI